MRLLRVNSTLRTLEQDAVADFDSVADGMPAHADNKHKHELVDLQQEL